MVPKDANPAISTHSISVPGVPGVPDISSVPGVPRFYTKCSSCFLVLLLFHSDIIFRGPLLQ